MISRCAALLALSSSPFASDAYALRAVGVRRRRSDVVVAAARATPSSSAAERYAGYSTRDSFNLVVLGDLHLEDDMSFHEQARDDCVRALRTLSLLPDRPSSSNDDDDDDVSVRTVLDELADVPAGELDEGQLEMMLRHRRDGGDLANCNLVSLGDLGRKDIRHEPGDAGTTASFEAARDFLDGFGLPGPYDLVTGNHDLEGLDEFDTDEANLAAWSECFGRDAPHFARRVGRRTLLVGLSTVRFRDAPHSSHECHVDDDQLDWFRRTVADHPVEDGWRILVFTHAPVMGSGLRVLQGVHVVNGCAWQNHCSPPDVRAAFVRIVRESPQIVLWASGHFHLSQDFPDSLSRVNRCTFVQVNVVGPKSTRDKTRQTRVVRGNSERMEIYSINHHVRDENGNAEIRLDAVLDLRENAMNLKYEGRWSTGDSSETSNGDEHEEEEEEEWFGAYVPREEDGCYMDNPSGLVANKDNIDNVVCWWHMRDGAVLGVHDGQIVEYDSETLSPLGIVVSEKELHGREVLVVDDSRAVVLVDPDHADQMEVVHPNDDGSYWRKFQRNKRVRQEEKARELAAKLWLERTGAT